ncbi:MAG: hypothetical protein OCD76_03760 [Reichenbachiella sp.]
MKSFLLFTVFIFTFPFLLHAQLDDFVYTVSGDTLKGNITYNGKIQLSKECHYRSVIDSQTTYYPEKIIGYQFDNGELYLSKIIDEQAFFVEQITTGSLRLFLHRDLGGDRFFIQKDSLPFKELIYSEKHKTINGSKKRIRSKKHIGLLLYYMDDTPQIHEKIKNIDQPNYDNLLKITSQYNQIKNPSQLQYQLKDDIRLLDRVLLEPLGGIQSYTNFESSGYAGLNIYLILPKSNRNLYFKTGIQNSFVLDYTKSGIWYIPLQLGLNNREKKVSLITNYGYNLYFARSNESSHQLLFNIEINIETGVSFRITDKIRLNLTPEISLAPILHSLYFEQNVFITNYGLYSGITIQL